MIPTSQKIILCSPFYTRKRPLTYGRTGSFGGKVASLWLHRVNSNHRPLGYEPNELPLLHGAMRASFFHSGTIPANPFLLWVVPQVASLLLPIGHENCPPSPFGLRSANTTVNVTGTECVSLNIQTVRSRKGLPAATWVSLRCTTHQSYE